MLCQHFEGKTKGPWDEFLDHGIRTTDGSRPWWEWLMPEEEEQLFPRMPYRLSKAM